MTHNADYGWRRHLLDIDLWRRPSASVCPVCAALIRHTDEERHVAWHDQIDITGATV